jgi:hypothetical protein
MVVIRNDENKKMFLKHFVENIIPPCMSCVAVGFTFENLLQVIILK